MKKNDMATRMTVQDREERKVSNGILRDSKRLKTNILQHVSNNKRIIIDRIVFLY